MKCRSCQSAFPPHTYTGTVAGRRFTFRQIHCSACIDKRTTPKKPAQQPNQPELFPA